MKKKFWLLLTSLSFLYEVKAQNQIKIESQYFNVYVLFGSECCGIDRQAFDELNSYIKKFQKKNASKLKYETMHWGKEGERVLYFDLNELSDNQALNFNNQIVKMFGLRQYKLVKTGLLLHYHLHTQTLWLHCIPFGINLKREKAFLTWIEKFEQANQIKILQGPMINETHLEEDQDKRYELDLSKLTEKHRLEFITQVKNLFQIKEKED